MSRSIGTPTTAEIASRRCRLNVAILASVKSREFREIRECESRDGIREASLRIWPPAREVFTLVHHGDSLQEHLSQLQLLLYFLEIRQGMLRCTVQRLLFLLFVYRGSCCPRRLD